jgi:hypothetical protein
MNIFDQRTKITIIQEQGFPLRGGSVLPDVSAPQYQIPRPPPPPPLFSNSSQAQSSARKRSRDVAFGGESSLAHSSMVQPIQRPRLATTSIDHTEYLPVESVEHDTLEEDDHDRRREGSVDLTQNSRPSVSRGDANVGRDLADHSTLADVEPKSESPDPQAPLQHLKPSSMFNLEALENAAATTQNMLKSTSSTRSEEQDEGLESSADHRPRHVSRDYAPAPPPRDSPARRRAVALAETSNPDVVQHGPTTDAPLQKQVQMQTWHNRPHPPITPPSDASPADMRGRFAHPAPKPVTSSVRATGSSNKFKTRIPRHDLFEPQSSIEDSQMSPRSKRKRTTHLETEITSTENAHSSSRSMAKAGKAKVPLSEMARPYDRGTPIVAGKRARNEPVNNFSQPPSFLGDVDVYQPQASQGTAQHELEPLVAVHDTIDDEKSTDQSVTDSQEKKEDLSKTASKINSLKYRHSRPALSDDVSASMSRERSRSVDEMDNDSNKGDHLDGRNRRPSGVQVHEPIVVAKNGDAFSADEVNFSTSGSRRPTELSEDFEISTERIEGSTDSRNKDLTAIDILNGGGLRGDKLDTSCDISEFRESGTPVRRPVELQDNASLAADGHKKRRKRKKKSQIEDDTTQLETEVRLVDFDIENDEPAKVVADGRQAVLGEAWHISGKRQARSEVETPTSTGSAGDQLQESLQASTQERTRSTKATKVPRNNSRFSMPSAAEVYEGVVRAYKGPSALVELQGVKGSPYGLLHRNGVSSQPLKGPIAKILPLEQVVKVKVTPSKVTNGSDAIVRLSMLNIDQVTGGFIQASLTEHQKRPLEPREDWKNASSAHDLPRYAGNFEEVASFQIQPTISQVNKADIEDGSATTLRERPGEAPQESVGTGTNAKSDSGVEVTRINERAETPENRDPPEPRFGLGFTNTPRKSKKRAASVEGAKSPTVPAAAPVRPGQEQTPIIFKDAALAHARRSGHEDTRDARTPQNGATRNISALHSKNTSVKSRSKKKLREKQSKSRDSTERVADVEQRTTPPQDHTNVSRNQAEPSLGGNASLLTRPTTTKLDVEPDEYVSFPPTMTKEQFLAQRQANVAAIARRDAAAAGKAGAATSSGPGKARTVTHSIRSTVKKQKSKPVNERPLSAAFETPPPPFQTSDKKTSNNKQHMIKHTHSDAEPESLNHDQKHLRSERDGISGQQSKDGTALSTKSKEIAKSQVVEPASTEPSALDSQATVTPTSSSSASPTPTKASNTTLPTVPMKLSLKPKAQVTDLKPSPVKVITPKPTQAKTPLNSKALSMAELKAQKEAAKKSTKASSSSSYPYKSTPTVSALRTAITLGSDSDGSESESESESNSSSDDTRKQKSGPVALKRGVFQKAVSRPDPTIRDRSMSVDVDDEDESD